MQRQSEAVDPENAQSAVVQLRMGAGELDVSGGADALMEANFAYNVSEWEPEGSYAVSGETGELSVEQGSDEGVRVGGDARNEWEVRFNDEVPTDLHVEMGAGESDLDLDRKSTRLNSSHANISYAVFCLKKKINFCELLIYVAHFQIFHYPFRPHC